MKYYYSTMTKRIIPGYELSAVKKIYGDDEVDNLVSTGGIVEVPAPSVVEFLKVGDKVAAYIRYKEIHKCDMKTARKMVNIMNADMQNIIKKEREKNGEQY